MEFTDIRSAYEKEAMRLDESRVGTPQTQRLIIKLALRPLIRRDENYGIDEIIYKRKQGIRLHILPLFIAPED